MWNHRRSVPAGMSRRHFLRHMATTALALPAFEWTRAIQSHAGTLRKQGKSVILLWMGGGPATIDMWDLKSASDTAGPFRPISTKVPGIQISEHLPRIANQMHHLAIIRSMSTREADHTRGRYKVHTGYVPTPTMDHPSFGVVTAYELGKKVEDIELPHFISIGTPSVGAGFLGMAHAPFVVQNPDSRIQNLQLPRGVESFRMGNRLKLLAMMENQFIVQRPGGAANDHRAVYEKTVRMMKSRQIEALDLDREDRKTRDRYGESKFGQGCLMARRLIQTGVTFVEVGLDGWDTHNDTFDKHQNQLQPQLDQGASALVEDLARRDLLEKTLVICLGEFGRTPRINQNAGRDHWARCWSVLLGGCGIQGGQVVGKTNRDGTAVEDRPLDVPDLLATFYTVLGIPLETSYETPNGRPYWVVNREADAQPIGELLA